MRKKIHIYIYIYIYIYIPWQIWVTILFGNITPDIRYDRSKYLVMSKRTLGKFCRRLRFCYKWLHKKWMPNMYFQTEILLKTRLRHRSFVLDFTNLYSPQLYWKRDSSAGVFLRISHIFRTWKVQNINHCGIDSDWKKDCWRRGIS